MNAHLDELGLICIAVGEVLLLTELAHQLLLLLNVQALQVGQLRTRDRELLLDVFQLRLQLVDSDYGGLRCVATATEAPGESDCTTGLLSALCILVVDKT